MNIKPNANEYGSYYERYILLVPDGNILDILSKQNDQVKVFFNEISEEISQYRYAEGKWSIREILGHIIDTERIFSYRALRISRNDKTALPGFEQDDYVPFSNHANTLLKNLVEEFFLLRKANLKLFASFTGEMWMRTGTASENPLSVKAAAYILAGHPLHHINVIKERYF